ncbi:hypothetical protein ACRALDRAFT_1077852 [Sodiomyces alcalophilus JCM 7366]|uniref:uncharacterized protein n=1 Tax=Sodiomyces alcalophilus JCM 7366 TaxID=591952 RepID=UPI0039B56CE3
MDKNVEKPVHENFRYPGDLVRWVEGQPEDTLVPTAQSIFDDLLARSSNFKESKGSSGGSYCQKLCGFVENCAQSKVPQLRAWAFSREPSVRLFNFYIEWNEVEQHRSMKLVLDILPLLIKKNPDAVTASSVKAAILDTLISIVGRKSTKPLVKSSFKALDQLTGKSLFTVEDIAASYRRVHSPNQWDSELDLWSDVVAQLFSRMAAWYMRAVAGKFIVTVYQALRQAPPGTLIDKDGKDEGFLTEIWLQWLQDALAVEPSLVDGMKNYIFLPLFKEDRVDSLRFLTHLKEIDPVSAATGSDIDPQASLHFAALEIGKKVGIVDEPDNAPPQGKASVVIEEAMLHRVLSHPSTEVRTLALSLITSSNSTTRPFSGTSLLLLKAYLPHHFSDPSPRFRMDLLGRVKVMYRRVRGAISVIQRAIQKADAKVSSSSAQAPKQKAGLSTEITRAWSIDKLQLSLRQHKEFLHWFLEFLTSELTPTASYQRHCSILKATLLVLKLELDDSKPWETDEDNVPFVAFFDATWIRAVLDRVIDDFEDVRQTSTDILKFIFSDGRFGNIAGPEGISVVIGDFLARAEGLSTKTGRADHADGVARSYELLCRLRQGQSERLLVVSGLVDRLESKLSLAELDLGRAVLEAPTHDTFASLCNLMRAMILPLKPKAGGWTFRPSVDTFAAIGFLTFEQLTYLRHRGAFTTVSLTFATCCQLVKHLSSTPTGCPANQTLLDVWYEGSLKCILTHASTTRRSAGIPAMVTGILSANDKSPSFEKVIADLVQIARKGTRVSETDGSNLPQVHALNCLKDIFKSSQLSQLGKTESHIPQCLELAAGCMKSEVWAIRNSGLLLLRSLIDNLLGTHESKSMMDAGWDGKAAKIHYRRYPVLPVVLLNLLRSGRGAMEPSTGTIAAEAVFPALDIIRRAGPPETARDELYHLISEYLGSSVWHVREMAARALCSFLLHDDWVQALRGIVNARGESRASLANRLHGVLLTIKYVFDRLTNVMPDLARRDVSHLLDLLVELYDDNPGLFLRCPDIHAAYAEILNLVSGAKDDTQVSAIDTDNSERETEVESPAKNPARGALLDNQLAVQKVYQSRDTGNIEQLTLEALATASSSPEATVSMLEAIPTVYDGEVDPKVAARLCHLLVAVCHGTHSPEPRAVAIENLADMMDTLAQRGQLHSIPSASDLEKLWTGSLERPMNPSLSNAIIRLSGCIMATTVSRQNPSGEGCTSLDLTNWSAMIADAGHEDQPFDTRFAAAQSLKSFLAGPLPVSPTDDQSYLPVLIVLYDALNDDDDEVRDMAAEAARPLLSNANLIPLEAADRLLSLLTSSFGHVPAFRALVASRIAGSISAAEGGGLAAALQFDDALFAKEEQNLYIDEVRESRRWTAVFVSLPRSEDAVVAGIDRALEEWTVAGLAAILDHTAQHHDGALGWTSLPAAYAVCARVFLSAVALTARGYETLVVTRKTVRT